MSETLLEVVKFVLPAILVLGTAYTLLKQLLDNQVLHKRLDMAREATSQSHSLKIQAYERLSLLMERISPPSLITRLREENMTAPEFQYTLITQLRSEFEHNLAQQLYVSDNLWVLIKSAVQETTSLINNQASTLPTEAGASDLGKAVLMAYIQYGEEYPTDIALRYLKAEVRNIL